MTDTGTRVPLLANWPSGIQRGGRVADDLVEFCDILPTLCDVTGADLPSSYPGDGVSILPILKDDAGSRKKDWIYIWYRGQVMVRNKQYSLLAKSDGSNAMLTRYSGPFSGESLTDRELSQAERALKQEFAITMQKLAKTRLTSVDKKAWSQAEDRNKGKKK